MEGVNKDLSTYKNNSLSLFHSSLTYKMFDISLRVFLFYTDAILSKLFESEDCRPENIANEILVHLGYIKVWIYSPDCLLARGQWILPFSSRTKKGTCIFVASRYILLCKNKIPIGIWV